MSNPVRLSITIPTYNRREYLEQNLSVLLPQVTNDVEIIVFDNCSTDTTYEYIQTIGSSVRYIRQESNLGPDRNMLSCLNEASGDFVWLLCDDDLPCSNAVSKIMEAVHSFPSSPMFYLRVTGGDRDLTNYDNTPVETGWTHFDANAFLTEISFLFTFASSIIVRRDCLNFPFILGEIDTNLIPAAIVLSTVGEYDSSVISDRPLLFGRGGNSGGYNALTVFSKNITKLFRRCDRKWFDTVVLNKTYNENLAVPMIIAIQDWPLNASGLGMLIRYGYRYSNFYRVLLPALIRRIVKRCIRLRFKQPTMMM